MTKVVTKTKDEIVKELFDIVQEKKKNIAKAEKPVWKTNCSFSFSEGVSNRINLQVVQTQIELVAILTHLIRETSDFRKANEILGLDLKFTWMGFTYEEWEADIKTRLAKLQVNQERKTLEALEARLDKLVSPEVKEQMELEELQKLIKG